MRQIKYYHVWARRGVGSFVSTYWKGYSAKEVRADMEKQGYVLDSRVTIAKYPPANN